MPRWSVDIIRKRAERLGTIEAANEKEAIEKAAKEFDIPPEGGTVLPLCALWSRPRRPATPRPRGWLYCAAQEAFQQDTDHLRCPSSFPRRAGNGTSCTGFLVSPRASSITGTEYVIDGGTALHGDWRMYRAL